MLKTFYLIVSTSTQFYAGQVEINISPRGHPPPPSSTSPSRVRLGFLPQRLRRPQKDMCRGVLKNFYTVFPEIPPTFCHILLRHCDKYKYITNFSFERKKYFFLNNLTTNEVKVTFTKARQLISVVHMWEYNSTTLFQRRNSIQLGIKFNLTLCTRKPDTTVSKEMVHLRLCYNMIYTLCISAVNRPSV